MATAIEGVGRDASGTYTVQHCLAMASELCEAADDAAWFDDLPAARAAYIEAEGWLWKADRLRGIDDGRPLLDARLEVERRMGLAN